MVKQHTTINIDSDLLGQAKEKGLVISDLVDDAIKDKLNLVDVSINADVDKCDFCGKEGKASTKDKPDLDWLWPDEKWICEGCLDIEKLKVPLGTAF